MALEVTTHTELRQPVDPNTGLYVRDAKPVPTEIEDIKASGKDCQALMGVMRDSAQQSSHLRWKRQQSEGVERISDPDGKEVQVYASQIPQYRSRGYCQKSMKISFSVQGWGKMRSESVLRQKVTYSRGSKTTWTVYKDGRETESVEVY